MLNCMNGLTVTSMGEGSWHSQSLLINASATKQLLKTISDAAWERRLSLQLFPLKESEAVRNNNVKVTSVWMTKSQRFTYRLSKWYSIFHAWKGLKQLYCRYFCKVDDNVSDFLCFPFIQNHQSSTISMMNVNHHIVWMYTWKKKHPNGTLILSSQLVCRLVLVDKIKLLYENVVQTFKVSVFFSCVKLQK